MPPEVIAITPAARSSQGRPPPSEGVPPVRGSCTMVGVGVGATGAAATFKTMLLPPRPASRPQGPATVTVALPTALGVRVTSSLPAERKPLVLTAPLFVVALKVGLPFG